MIFHDFFKLFRVVSCSVSTPGKTRDNTPLNDTLHHQQHTRTHTHTFLRDFFWDHHGTKRGSGLGLVGHSLIDCGSPKVHLDTLPLQNPMTPPQKMRFFI